MSGDIAKRIFAKFLKERKLMGIALVYFFGKPSYNNLKMYSSNIKVLNESARKADNGKDINFISQYLIDMAGRTRDPNIILKKFKHDYLYDIYIEWKKYVEKNKKQIYQKYYQKNKNE